MFPALLLEYNIIIIVDDQFTVSSWNYAAKLLITVETASLLEAHQQVCIRKLLGAGIDVVPDDNDSYACRTLS